MSREICRSRSCMRGCVGSEVRRLSRCRIRDFVESGRFGICLGM